MIGTFLITKGSEEKIVDIFFQDLFEILRCIIVQQEHKSIFKILLKNPS